MKFCRQVILRRCRWFSRTYDEAAQAAKQQGEMLSEKMRSETDVLNTRLMMTTKAIDSKDVRKLKNELNVKGDTRRAKRGHLLCTN